MDFRRLACMGVFFLLFHGVSSNHVFGIVIQHEVSVVLKLVPVHVTDRNGKPMAGLKRDEFSLFVDGTKIEITDFEEHRSAEIQGLAPMALARNAARDGNSNLLNRKIILFFDFAFNSTRGIRLSRETALKFLEEKAAPEDEIAVISYSTTKGLRVHEFFSKDRVRARAVVESFGFNDILGRAEDVEQHYLEFTRSQEEGGTKVPGMEALEVNPGNAMSRNVSQSQVRLYLNRLEELTLALRYIPGNKYWLFFSSGPPSSLVFVKTGFQSLSPRAREEYEDLLKELSASNCIIFPFDAHEFGGSEASVSGAYTLERMAKQTGGRFYGNIGSPKNLDDIQSLTEAYYVLGFPIHESLGTGFHDIKVAVNRSGCRISAPAGFFDTKPFKKMSPFERALHLVDVALSETPLYQIPLTMPMRAYYAPFPVVSSVLLVADLPVAALRNGNFKKVEIVDILMDSRGKIALLQGDQVDIGAFYDSPVVYWSVRSVPPDTYDCRTVIRDLDTGRAVVGSAKISIGEDGKPIQFFPPIFLMPSDPSQLGPRACSFLAASGRRVEAGSMGPLESLIPSTSSFRPFLGIPPETVNKLLVVFPYRAGKETVPEFRAVFWGVDAEAMASEPQTLILKQKHAESGGFIAFEVPMDVLRGGKQIGLRFEDAISGFSHISRIGLTSSTRR